MYKYNAKNKEETFDATPLVLVLKYSRRYVLGINFHWAPIPLRIVLVKKILNMNKRNIKEGKYRRYNVVTFDHNTRQDSAILTSDLTGIHIAEKGIHDILSCFYWFRNRILPGIDTIQTGDVITITTWFTDELYPVSLKYIGSEEVRTKAGKMKAYKFNPATEVGRLFKTQEDVTIWFSADKNFIPVKIRFDIFVGAFMVELVNYEGLIYPLEIKKR